LRLYFIEGVEYRGDSTGVCPVMELGNYNEGGEDYLGSRSG
jgi:hypothetical protein